LGEAALGDGEQTLRLLSKRDKNFLNGSIFKFSPFFGPPC
jgi:hypothetical protein